MLQWYHDEIFRLWPHAGEPPSRELLNLCLHAVDEYPADAILWYDLGIIMHRCSEDFGYTANDYLRCFENSIKFDSRNAEAYQELGLVLDVYFSDYDKAEQALRKAIDFGAGHESYHGLARVLAQIGKTEDAILTLAESNCPFYDHPEIQKLRAEIVNGSW